MIKDIQAFKISTAASVTLRAVVDEVSKGRRLSVFRPMVENNLEESILVSLKKLIGHALPLTGFLEYKSAV